MEGKKLSNSVLHKILNLNKHLSMNKLSPFNTQLQILFFGRNIRQSKKMQVLQPARLGEKPIDKWLASRLMLVALCLITACGMAQNITATWTLNTGAAAGTAVMSGADAAGATGPAPTFGSGVTATEYNTNATYGFAGGGWGESFAYATPAQNDNQYLEFEIIAASNYSLTVTSCTLTSYLVDASAQSGGYSDILGIFCSTSSTFASGVTTIASGNGSNGISVGANGPTSFTFSAAVSAGQPLYVIVVASADGNRNVEFGATKFVLSGTATLNCTTPSTPSFTGGVTALCVGGTTTYTASSTGTPSPTYQWSVASGATIGSSTGAVTNVTSGYTVSVSAENSCGTVTNSEAITVYTLPVVNSVTATNPACVGTVIALTANTTAGSGGAISTYTWTGTGNGLASASTSVNTNSATPTFASSQTYPTSVTYSVSVTDVKNCASASAGTTSAISITAPNVQNVAPGGVGTNGATLNSTY
jgi:hypothetical protein